MIEEQTHNSAQDAGGERNSASLVERVARAFQAHEWKSAGPPWESIPDRAKEQYRERAQVALEASHHAELVELARSVQAFWHDNDEAWGDFASLGSAAVAFMPLAHKADDVLAKIGADK